MIELTRQIKRGVPDVIRRNVNDLLEAGASGLEVCIGVAKRRAQAFLERFAIKWLAVRRTGDDSRDINEIAGAIGGGVAVLVLPAFCSVFA